MVTTWFCFVFVFFLFVCFSNFLVSFFFFLNERHFRKICVSIFFFINVFQTTMPTQKLRILYVILPKRIVCRVSVQLGCSFSEQPHHQWLEGPSVSRFRHKHLQPTGVLFMQDIFSPPDDAKDTLLSSGAIQNYCL